MATQDEQGGRHRLDVAVRWGHCDPAGIVYYPVYYDFFHQAMETWFDRVLGVPYRSVIETRRIGFPSVHTEADYHAPSTYGDRLCVMLAVSAMGRTSLTFALSIEGPDGGLRVSGRKTVVAMDLDPASPTFRRAIPIPDDVRGRIEAFGIAPAAPA